MNGEARFRIGSGVVVAAAVALFVGLRFGPLAGGIASGVLVGIVVESALVPVARRARTARAPFPAHHREAR